MSSSYPCSETQEPAADFIRCNSHQGGQSSNQHPSLSTAENPIQCRYSAVQPSSRGIREAWANGWSAPVRISHLRLDSPQIPSIIATGQETSFLLQKAVKPDLAASGQEPYNLAFASPWLWIHLRFCPTGPESHANHMLTTCWLLISAWQCIQHRPI